MIHDSLDRFAHAWNNDPPKAPHIFSFQTQLRQTRVMSDLREPDAILISNYLARLRDSAGTNGHKVSDGSAGDSSRNLAGAVLAV